MKYSNKLLVELLILFIVVCLAVSFFYVAKVFIVDGTSMLPTLKSGERILVDKRAYVYVDPIKGDIVGMMDPNEPALQYVKRVIASSNDVIEVNGFDVRVNDKPIYKVSGYAQKKRIVIPKGYFFVMGDNRQVSYDSREFGLVPRSNIIGKAVAVVWPVSSMRMVK